MDTIVCLNTGKECNGMNCFHSCAAIDALHDFKNNRAALIKKSDTPHRHFETVKERDAKMLKKRKPDDGVLLTATHEENIAHLMALLQSEDSDRAKARKVVNLMYLSFNQGVYAKKFMRHFVTGTYKKYKRSAREFPLAMDMDEYQRRLGLKQ
jgi:hypothetical protein